MLEEKIYQAYIQALKAKNRPNSEFLSLIRSELKNQAINLKKEKLPDNEVLAILKKQQKKLTEAKEMMASSGRDDLLKDLERELAILNKYLPEPLSDQELAKIVTETIAELGASTIKNMGKVMKEVLAKVGAAADSKKVSNLVREKLSSN